jgi:hypothetical protein
MEESPLRVMVHADLALYQASKTLPPGCRFSRTGWRLRVPGERPSKARFLRRTSMTICGSHSSRSSTWASGRSLRLKRSLVGMIRDWAPFPRRIRADRGNLNLIDWVNQHLCRWHSTRRKLALRRQTFLQPQRHPDLFGAVLGRHSECAGAKRTGAGAASSRS